jgi:hypothetical protein
MKSDVKAVRKTDATSVFAGRTRLRGIILASTGSAGSVTLQDGNSVTQFQVDVPAGDVSLLRVQLPLKKVFLFQILLKKRMKD